MSFRYAIKGMVCHRCDLALAEVAANSGGELLQVGRGFADFAERLSPNLELTFERQLQAIEFSLLRSEQEAQAEAVELALRALVEEHPMLSQASEVQAGLSPNLEVPFQQAAQLFQAHTGHTPLERLNTLRMEWAAERLREGRLQVSEVGYALGYRHLSGFSRAFKRTMGVSPIDLMGEAQSAHKHAEEG